MRKIHTFRHTINHAVRERRISLQHSGADAKKNGVPEETPQDCFLLHRQVEESSVQGVVVSLESGFTQLVTHKHCHLEVRPLAHNPNSRANPLTT